MIANIMHYQQDILLEFHKLEDRYQNRMAKIQIRVNNVLQEPRLYALLIREKDAGEAHDSFVWARRIGSWIAEGAKAPGIGVSIEELTKLLDEGGVTL